MSLQVEKLENNTAKLTIEVPAEELDKAIQKAYQKNKNKFNVPGFRKGKVPYAMIEKMYGAGVFYEEAANDLIPEAYANAAAESELEIVARPEISVTQIEKGKPFVFEAEVTLKPEVKLGEYKGIKVEKADTKVTAKAYDKVTTFTKTNENGEDVYTVNTVTDTELVAVQETGVGVITKTGTVNTDVAGTYQVVYSVKDAAGNLGTKVLTVIVTE